MADKRDPLAFADVEGNMLQRLNLGKTFAETTESAACRRLENGLLERTLVRVKHGKSHADVVCLDIHLL